LRLTGRQPIGYEARRSTKLAAYVLLRASLYIPFAERPTPSRAGSGWALLWFLLIITGAPCAAQISPGKLTLAHQAFNGPTKCTGCHSLASGKPSFKCLNCHAEIRSKVEAKTGFHGTVVRRDGGTKQECVRCHTDHYGDNFKIVKWEPSRDDFDHRQTGYPLQGRHGRVECAKCHRQDHIAKSDLVVIKIKDKTKTYLGLSERCSTCHVDEHRGQLGPDCARCHASLETWKQPSKFNHTAAKFQLTGLHQNVTCDKCHRPDLEAAAKPFVKYTNVPFASCADCHRDPHRGAFAGSCDSCHGDEGWKRLKTATGFDHSKTKFPLLGKHVKAACLDCHKTSNFKAPVEHEKCANCHQKDNPHKTQFAAQDCDACHTVDGYKPSTFTISRHQTSRYKLVGKHEIVECVKCHFPAGKDADYRPAYAACRDCHKDAHGGQFTKSYEDRCDTCHTEAGFKPSTSRLRATRKRNLRWPADTPPQSASSATNLSKMCIRWRRRVSISRTNRAWRATQIRIGNASTRPPRPAARSATRRAPGSASSVSITRRPATR